MELINGIKSMLAQLSSKTSMATTDGVPLINTSDGEPNGRLGLEALQRSVISPYRSLLTSDSWDTLTTPGIYYATTSALPSSGTTPPVCSEGTLLVLVQNGRIAQIYWEMSSQSTYLRTYNGSSWASWAKYAFDVPAFYNSYANLQALAAGIMNSTISSITASYFQGTIAQAVFDNVLIAVTRLSDTFPLAVKPKDWSSYSSASSYHVDGVLLISGEHKFVIAPDDTSLRWGADSDSHASTGNTTTTDRDVAMARFDGKACTATAYAADAEYQAADTAIGYCTAYTTATADYDTTKTAYARRKPSMWYLPSLGEMMMIWSNMQKINQVMALIGGAALQESWYWTSTEYSQTIAWGLSLSDGGVINVNKKNSCRVRPVAAF